MYAAFLEKTHKSIAALKSHLATSDALRSEIHEKGTLPPFSPQALSINSAPDRLEWKLIDHCTAVTRLYAIYEQFAQEMIREHLALLQNNVAFEDLPTELKSAYRKGFATILDKKEGPRYGHLDLSNLVEQYGSALSGQSYTLEPLALLIQEQNLRLPELTRLFAASGIANINTWIDKHRCIKEFFELETRIGSSSEHELRELIKYRNEAAHGSIDLTTLLGLDYLYEFCDFISAVCEAISERVQKTGLESLITSGSAALRGKVSECLKSDTVLIGNMAGNFVIGDTIYLSGDDYCLERKIVSLQLDGADYSELSLIEPTELGLAVDKPGRNRSKLIAIIPEEPVINDTLTEDNQREAQLFTSEITTTLA